MSVIGAVAYTVNAAELSDIININHSLNTIARIKSSCNTL